MATFESRIQHPQHAPPPPPPKPKMKSTNHIAHESNHVSSQVNYQQNGNGNHNHNHHNHNHSDTVPPLDEEKVVMTPKGKTSNSTVILIERKLIDTINERQHVAGGDHTGIIINKDTANGVSKSQLPQAQLSLEFRVFLVSGNTGHHSQEARTLRFWFRPWITNGEKHAHVAQDFFRELVSPKEFPRGNFCNNTVVVSLCVVLQAALIYSQ